MAEVKLFIDEDGAIWHDERGTSREVGSLSWYSYDDERMATEEEAVANAVAESTDDEAGTFTIYNSDTGEVFKSGSFTQGRDGVSLK